MTAAVARDGALPRPVTAGPHSAWPGRPRARRRLPGGLLVLSILVAAVLLVPLAFLLTEAAGAGVGQVAALIDRQLTVQLLWNTVRLSVVVTALCAVIGTGTAWLTERTNLPGWRVWMVLLVVPLAIPDFVVSFGWASISTDVTGFRGAVLVMTLSVFPLVYLPVAASFRNADPTQEEVARSLGAGRIKTFFRITLGQAKVAILGGLPARRHGLAGRVRGIQHPRLPDLHDRDLHRVPAALRHRVRLRALSRAGRADPARTGSGRARPSARAGQPGDPYWWVQGTNQPFQGTSRLSATGYTAAYGACAAALATAMALPVAILAVRRSGRVAHLIERSTYLVLAMPGLVIALSLSYFSNRYGDGIG